MYQNNICLKELMTTHHMERKGLLALEQQFKDKEYYECK
jgi:translation initiation factor 2 beta subunit (eIF-2beta)/eIF-5